MQVAFTQAPQVVVARHIKYVLELLHHVPKELLEEQRLGADVAGHN